MGCHDSRKPACSPNNQFMRRATNPCAWRPSRARTRVWHVIESSFISPAESTVCSTRTTWSPVCEPEASRRFLGSPRPKPQFPLDSSDESRGNCWWTRTRRIRTTASLPIDVPILEINEAPVYQRIASKAEHLEELGMNQSEIGRRLGVDRWTVGKALRWLKGVAGRPSLLIPTKADTDSEVMRTLGDRV